MRPEREWFRRVHLEANAATEVELAQAIEAAEVEHASAWSKVIWGSYYLRNSALAYSASIRLHLLRQAAAARADRSAGGLP